MACHFMVLPLCAATTPAGMQAASKSVALTVKAADKNVDVVVPSGCTSVLVEVRVKNSARWVRWSSTNLSGKPTLLNVAKTYSPQIVEWRATGQVNRDKALAFAAKSKFPDRFYQGSRAFAKTPALGYKPAGSTAATDANRLTAVPLTVASSVSSNKLANSSVAVADSTTASLSSQVVEADIWKTDGNTVYFFNQLRGLQVLDISDPSNPLLIATLRMPAIGQDLYLLPENISGSGERDLVLLTRDPDGSYNSTNVVVVRVSGRSVQEVSRTSIRGCITDSRMAGGRLFVVTTDWNMNGDSAYNTLLSEVLVEETGMQTLGAVHHIASNAYSGVISAGTDWLSVASTSYIDGGNHSQITLFSLDNSGATCLTQNAIATRGCIYDKYNVSYQNGTLTAVSISWGNGTLWKPVSVLENFTVSGTKLASLEIMPGETLRATRFIDGKVYVVTAQTTDPLWIVDISDPNVPSITGSVEVPGFSTYIEPMGDFGQFLFTIGLDGGKVAASLFNVEDVTSPTLVDRVFINENQWGYSEAVYDEKALKVLHEEGLALIPFSASFWSRAASKSEKTSFVRLIDISLENGGKLNLRGRLDHDFTPRRATLINGILTSISQKELITANVDDRDKPKVLADVALAWPVNQVIQSGEYLIQISDGSSSVWSGDKAAIRVSKAASESSILTDIDLNDGIVQEAVLKSSKLYVLRKNWNPNNGFGLMACFVGMPSNVPTSAELALDVYDASTLPALKLLGTTSVRMGSTDTNCEISGLLWAKDTLPLVITQIKPPRFCYPMVAYDMVKTTDSPLPMVSQTVRYSTSPNFKAQPAYVRAFDVSNPAAPVALKPYPLATTTTTLVSGCAAGDGLLVFGYGQNPSPWNSARWRSKLEIPQSYDNRLGILDLTNQKSPLLRSPVSLPGRLLALGEISKAGFLAYTESIQDTAVGAVRQLQASLVDEVQASLFSSTTIGNEAVLSIDGRTVYVSDSQKMTRLLLDDSANFIQAGDSASLGFAPVELLSRGQAVFGTNGFQVLRISWPGLSPVLESWKVREWFPLSRISIGLDRSIYAPVGDYGVNILNSSNANIPDTTSSTPKPDGNATESTTAALSGSFNTVNSPLGTSLSGGAITIGGANSGSFVLTGTSTTMANTAGSTIIAGGTLVTNGLVLSGANTYTATSGMSLNAGILTIGVANSGSLISTGTIAFIGTSTLTVGAGNTIVTGGTLVLSGTSTLVLNNTSSNGGSVRDVSGGLLTLGNPDAATGISTFTSGTVMVQTPPPALK